MRFFLATAAVLCLATSALADATNSSVANVPQTTSSATDFLRNVTITADTRLYGTSLSEPTSSLSPNVKTGKLQYPLMTENKLNVGYRLGNGYSVGFQLWGNLDAVREHNFSWTDPSVVFRKNNLIEVSNENGRYSLSAGLRVYAGLSDNSKRYGQPVMVRLETGQTYSFAGTGFRLGGYAHAQKNFLKNPDKKNAWASQYLIIPSAEYQISRTVAAQVSYKTWFHHEVGVGNSALGLDMVSEKALLGPGVMWNATPWMNVNPYLDFAVANDVNADTTTWGLFTTFKIL